MAPPDVISELANVSEADWRATRVIIEHLAVTSGALSGSLHAIRREFDLAGVTVIGLATGLGGGLLRDIMIAHGPVLALQRPSLLMTALLTCLVGMILGHRAHRLRPALWFVEAASLGLFTTTGVQRAEEVGLSMVPAIFLGVVTGTCGGLLRDVLSREMPALLVPGRPIAFPALFGGLAYYGASHGLDWPRVVSEWLAVLAAFGFKAVASWRKWVVKRPEDVFRMPEGVREWFSKLRDVSHRRLGER